jgi:hypothetical protein
VPLFALLWALLPDVGSAAALHRWLRGEVGVDADGDGRADRGDGVAGVKLSNGRDVVLTDARGRYRIALRDDDTLFLIKPAGWAPVSRADGLPDLWQHERRRASQGLRYGGLPRSRAGGDFLLRPAPEHGAGFEVLLFGDPQPKRREHVEYFRRDIVEPLLGGRWRLGISLGDIVDDDLSLFPPMLQSMAQLRTPWLHVAGNHDIDFDAASDRASLDTYRRHFGPETVAWEEPGVSFIGLDNVLYDPATQRYAGGLREDQFEFLASYLATLSDAQRIVLAVHIPLFRGFDNGHRQRLFDLLARFRQPLVLSAHSHVQQHVFHAVEQGWKGRVPLHEYNVGAACGGFWSGPLDAVGIPDARMADGTPNGYATLRFDAAGGYALRWHVARDADDPAMHLHAPKVLRRGAWPGVPVVANVYMADIESQVQVRIDDGPWRAMRRDAAADPVLVWENLRDDASPLLRGVDRMVQAVDSSHLYRYNLPTDLAAGEHRIQVRYHDRWRGELRASTSYRLVEMP